MRDGHAQTGKNFLISKGSGYGLEDCLSGNRECGKAVADAWCEALGHRAATTFGPSPEDSTIWSRASSEAVGPYFVTCDD